MATVFCAGCGAENRAGRRFCSRCGTALDATCPACGAVNDPEDQFCGGCGAPLRPAEAAAAAPAAAAGPAGAAPVVGPAGAGPVAPSGPGAPGPPGGAAGAERPAAPVAERRLVSVLFADLVGFTTLSEGRDPEEVRELLSRYFERSRRIVARRGGVVEKFIGDAVMAVWGTPVAREDDAVRAVRVALELCDMVSALGEETGLSGLRLRAGVTTRETAVTLGAEGEGMVAGDAVNTAARIQAAAEPGTALVDEATRRASVGAVEYEEAGSFQLKGKAAAVEAWRPVRALAGPTRAGPLGGIEAPHTGRDRELGALMDALDAVVEGGGARGVSVVGAAGVGKSRLAEELEQHAARLERPVAWNVGRCVSYGEGVAFYALAEAFRQWFGLVEGEDPDGALAKVVSAVEGLVGPEEAAFLVPRLAHLVGVAVMEAPNREELFSAWRLVAEHRAARGPVVLVFEDLHWADEGLLDFIEHLLDWSRHSPLLVVTLARPELLDRRPTWGSGRRTVTTTWLDPLPPAAMEELVGGIAPGLPADLTGRILDRAEGVPLYALETLRMLVDRGLLERDGARLLPTGEVGDLEVPETLQALVAARLDGLPAEERRLLGDAGVLGQVFTAAGVAAVSGLPPAAVEPVLASLVRKELVAHQEGNYYRFVQGLVRKVAYDTLSRAYRKARHLAAARHLQAAPGGDAIPGVVAAHYVDAWRSDPGAPDAAELVGRARAMIGEAGERAAGMAAPAEAQRYFDEGAGLADDPVERARLSERAGEMAALGGDVGAAQARLEAALAVYEEAGRARDGARVAAHLGEVLWRDGRYDEALTGMRGAFEPLQGEEPDEDLAALAAQLGRLEALMGREADAEGHLHAAIVAAERLDLAGVLAEALSSLALLLRHRGLWAQPAALLTYALEHAEAAGATAAALRAANHLAALLVARGDPAAPEVVERGLDLARRRGDRSRLLHLHRLRGWLLYLGGHWEEALAGAEEADDGSEEAASLLLFPRVVILAHRGQLEAAEAQMARCAAAADSRYLVDASNYAAGRAALLAAAGNWKEAVVAAGRGVEALRGLPAEEQVCEVVVEALEASLAAGDEDGAEAVLVAVESLPRGHRPPYLEAQRLRFRARLAAARGDGGAAAGLFEQAVEAFSALDVPFARARAQREWAAWLASAGRTGEAALLSDAARSVLDGLGVVGAPAPEAAAS